MNNFNYFSPIDTSTITKDLDPAGLRQALQLGLHTVGLRKIYQHKKKFTIAIDNLGLSLYEGQVLALLGHNGAGKTTLM